MKTAPTSVSVLLIASVGAGLLMVGCAHQQEAPAPSAQSSAGVDEAVAKIQSDPSKSPEEKVKEIDAIQRQSSGGQTPKHRKRSNDLETGANGG